MFCAALVATACGSPRGPAPSGGVDVSPPASAPEDDDHDHSQSDESPLGHCVDSIAEYGPSTWGLAGQRRYAIVGTVQAVGDAVWNSADGSRWDPCEEGGRNSGRPGAYPIEYRLVRVLVDEALCWEGRRAREDAVEVLYVTGRLHSNEYTHDTVPQPGTRVVWLLEDDVLHLKEGGEPETVVVGEPWHKWQVMNGSARPAHSGMRSGAEAGLGTLKRWLHGAHARPHSTVPLSESPDW